MSSDSCFRHWKCHFWLLEIGHFCQNDDHSSRLINCSSVAVDHHNHDQQNHEHCHDHNEKEDVSVVGVGHHNHDQHDHGHRHDHHHSHHEKGSDGVHSDKWG